jgi:hypothetical protein
MRSEAGPFATSSCATEKVSITRYTSFALILPQLITGQPCVGGTQEPLKLTNMAVFLRLHHDSPFILLALWSVRSFC